MEQKSELKPCPWCGKVPIVRKVSNDAWYVRCENSDNCHVDAATICFDTEEEAVQAWNSMQERTGECICIKGGPMYDTYRYTCCGYEHAESVSEDYGVQNYCPNCGAKVVHDA